MRDHWRLRRAESVNSLALSSDPNHTVQKSVYTGGLDVKRQQGCSIWFLYDSVRAAKWHKFNSFESEIGR